MRTRAYVFLLFCCGLLGACGDDETAARKAALGDDGLPKPAAPGGSVTGMPNPGEAGTRPAAPAVAYGDGDEVDPPEPEDEGAPPTETPMPQDLPPPADGAPEMVPLPPLDPTPPPPPPPEQLRSGEPAAEQQ